MMTIQEAAKQWGVKEKTIMGYILKKYLSGSSIENDEFYVPNIPKPHVKTKPKCVSEQDKYILEAMNKGRYVNANILGIEQEKFKERLEALVRANKIYPKCSNTVDYTSNLGFVLSSSDKKVFDLAVAATIEINPTAEVKFADQIGLINGRAF